MIWTVCVNVAKNKIIHIGTRNIGHAYKTEDFILKYSDAEKELEVFEF